MVSRRWRHRFLSRWRRTLGTVGLLLSLAACISSQEADLPATRVSVPSALAQADRVFWSPTDMLVLSVSGDQTWYRTGPNAPWQPLATAHLCNGSPASVNAVLADGRLVLLCPVDLQNQRILWQLFVYDWATQRQTPFVNDVLPAPGSTTWSPNMQHGVLSAGRSYSTLYWLTASTIQVFTTTLTKDNKVWSLADSPQALANYDKPPISFGRGPHPVGEVGAVGWSPVADQLAFWATLEPIGQSDVFLRSWTWDLYLMDTRTQQVERVLEDVYEGGGVEWSPDGQWILYTTGARGSQPAGLWLFSLHTRKPVLLQQGPFRDVAWAPDGQHILALRGNEQEEAEAWLYDVSSLLQSVQ